MTSDFFQGGLKAYQEIFWPNFIEHDGCVLMGFEASDETTYQQWFQQMRGNKRKIESVMNHRHIVDLLPEAVESPTQSLIVDFGQLLRDIWDAKLKRDFPARRFCVSFPVEGNKILTDYEITFYKIMDVVE